MKRSSIIYPLAGVLLFLLAWQFAAACVVRQSYLLPTPLAVLRSFAANLPLLLQHSRYTLIEAVSGMAVSVVLALALALVMSLFRRLREAVYPLLVISQMIPIIVLAPLFLIWFGYGMLPKVLVVILICFFPMVIQALAGLAAADGEMLAFYRAMGMSRRQLFTMVRLPFALPYFFGGLRVSATYSVMGAVIGEWLGAEAGLGLLLTRAQRSFDLPLTFAAILAIILWSALIFAVVALLERVSLRWQRVDADKWE